MEAKGGKGGQALELNPGKAGQVKSGPGTVPAVLNRHGKGNHGSK